MARAAWCCDEDFQQGSPQQRRREPERRHSECSSVLNAGQAGLIALALAFTAFTAAIAVFRYREMVHEKTFGATTVVAAMLAFALGALAVMGDKTAAAAAGVAAALLLALKSALPEWLKRLTWEELRAGLILAAMTVILLPLLPDRELSPAFPVNPHEIWLLTILIAALSFAGYVAIRLAGPSIGVLLSGLPAASCRRRR